ncbi:MAG: hypothetical protein DIJKHBIC_02314 [Thermoanaerobaculia bacterium]|nr:hypothetical protein [Thermoanaerobaculia bacterium]
MNGFVVLLNEAKNPRQELGLILEELEKVRAGEKPTGRHAAIKKWLPNSPKKAAAWIAVILELMSHLSQKPANQSVTNIEVTQIIQKIHVEEVIGDLRVSEDDGSGQEDHKQSPK